MIFVDELAQWTVRRKWCHMVTDGDVAELNAFAKKIGLKPEWLQDKNKRYKPHYDLVASKRELAIKHGAIEVNSHDFIKLVRIKTN